MFATSVAGRISNGLAGDLVCRGHVSLQQHRRDREHVRDVVKPVPGIVRRKQGWAVNFHRQQIAYDVGIFGPVQPMDGGSARIGLGDGRFVEFRFQICGERVVARWVGSRHVPAGHGSGPEFADHLFPIPAHLRLYSQHPPCRASDRRFRSFLPVWKKLQ